MQISQIEFEEIRVSLSFHHDDVIDEEYLGQVLEFQEMHQGRLIGGQGEERIFDMGLSVHF